MASEDVGDPLEQAEEALRDAVRQIDAERHGTISPARFVQVPARSPRHAKPRPSYRLGDTGHLRWLAAGLVLIGGINMTEDGAWYGWLLIGMALAAMVLILLTVPRHRTLGCRGMRSKTHVSI